MIKESKNLKIKTIFYGNQIFLQKKSQLYLMISTKFGFYFKYQSSGSIPCLDFKNLRSLNWGY